MEAEIGSFLIYDGGSEKAEMIANINVTMYGTKISTSRNQIFVLLHTDENNIFIRLHAVVIESK